MQLQNSIRDIIKQQECCNTVHIIYEVCFVVISSRIILRKTEGRSLSHRLAIFVHIITNDGFDWSLFTDAPIGSNRHSHIGVVIESTNGAEVREGSRCRCVDDLLQIYIFLQTLTKIFADFEQPRFCCHNLADSSRKLTPSEKAF